MKIILNTDVHNLGEEGDVCDVARGYARNYLVPQGMAVMYTKQTSTIFEHRRAAIEKRKEEKRKAALGLKEKIEEIRLTIKMPVGDTGKLFGSVNNAVVAEELQKLGISVERKKIEIPEHSIRMIGEYTAKIKLYSDEVATISVNVISDKEPAKPKGGAEVKAAAPKEEVTPEGDVSENGDEEITDDEA